MDLPSSPPPPTAVGGTEPDDGPAEAPGVANGAPSEGPVEERRAPWGLAGLTLLAAAVLSGLPLATVYRPVPAWVGADLGDLRELGWMGYVQRLHGGLAEAAVLAFWLLVIWSAVRGVYHFGAIQTSTKTAWRRPPGRRAWNLLLIGLALVMAWATSGRLLRWDGVARQTLDAWLGAAGDPATTLLFTWAIHCVLLPALALLALWWFFGRGRRAEPGE